MKPMFAVAVLVALRLSTWEMNAETRPARLTEAPTPKYVLPDPLVDAAGHPVPTAAAWRSQRRPELLELFAREIYGRTRAGRPQGMSFEVASTDPQALGGKATRKEVTIRLGAEPTAPVMHLLIYLPNAPKPPGGWPAFLGLNFYGNHTVAHDPRVEILPAWVPDEAPGAVDHRATEASRGSDASKWQAEAVLARGYATATVYCGELCPDRPDGLAAGVNAWLGGKGTENRAGDEWGAIGVWAWGLSRAMDYLETDADIDAKRVALHGHSRLGKTALWAGAQDERFALVISNDSGCGGAALSKRAHGETVAKINQQFPHWFAKNFRRYNDHEAALPLDQHELLALVAPRPLYVASAEDDDWADPRGEFLSLKNAAPVYRLLGRSVPAMNEMPTINTPAGDVIRYHIREGKHDLTAFDWTAYLDFADRWLRRSVDK